MSTARVIRGVDHLGITVPDLESASRFLIEAFNAVPMYDNLTPTDPPQAGPYAETMLGLGAGGAVLAIRRL